MRHFVNEKKGGHQPKMSDYGGRVDNGNRRYERVHQSAVSGGMKDEEIARKHHGDTGTRSGLPISTAGRAKGALLQDALAIEEYGSIISIRSSFGFIQNIHSDEQVYFSEQDIFSGVKVGDHVSFTAHQSSKGLAALKIKHIPEAISVDCIATKVLGTISRVPERHRSNCGLIDVELSTIPAEFHSLLRRKPANVVAYRPQDIDTEILPRNVSLDRGDYVEFNLTKVIGTNLILASEIRLKQLKRDRDREKAVSQQIQRMLDAGAVREIGVITAIKNKEYGFIKAQDRKDELYFRIDGFLSEADANIKEGTEVEFFVVAEMVRGRLSDRAMHLRIIPQGSVQFEAIVARDALVTVVSEPGLQPEETPGIGVLPEPVSVADITKKENDVINDVEVWQRCMPDEMVCKRGDILKVNVHYYRPEKLFFIRAVRLVEPFLLGRDKGTICSIKEAAGFGFITSDSRKIDLYFRLNQVISVTGDMMKKHEVVEGLRVSFDVIFESDKLRATRVKVLVTEKTQGAENAVAPTRLPIKTGVYGKVVRSTTAKKDSVGLIQISPEVWREIQEFEYIDPDLNNSLASFLSKMFLQEITIPCISTSMRKQLCALIDKDFLELMYEVVDGEIVDGTMQRHLRITKLYGGKRTAAPSSQVGPKHGKEVIPKDGYTLSYTREDYVTEKFGPLGNDMEVLVDVVWDVVKGKRVGHSVRLTDEPVGEPSVEHFGIIDVFIEKGDKFGFIRCVPSWEKLFWHVASVVEGNVPLLKQGVAVAFSLRRRGGMRCAAQIRVLASDEESFLKISREESVISPTDTDPLLAIVVERNRAILLDAQQIPLLKDKLLSLTKMNTLLAEGDSSSKTWGKGVKVTGSYAGKDTAAAAAATSAQESEDGNVTANSTIGPLSESGSISSENNRVEYAAKYFTQIDREPIIITNAIPDNSGSSSSATAAANSAAIASGAISVDSAEEPSASFKVGDIVEVSLSLDWSLVQPITTMTVLRVVSQVLGGSLKRRGTLTKTKHRFKNMPHLSDFYHLNNIDFAEITELEEVPISEKDSALAASAPPPNASTTGNVVPTKQNINYYFCVQTDIRGAGNEVAVGDDVEFCVTPMFPNIALLVRKIPRANKEHELNFHSNRQGINDKLKEMKSKVGTTNVVSMAAGPPSDAAKGFEPGWRHIDAEKLSALPWASSLLGHLVPNASTIASNLPIPAVTEEIVTPPPIGTSDDA